MNDKDMERWRKSVADFCRTSRQERDRRSDEFWAELQKARDEGLSVRGIYIVYKILDKPLA